MHIETRSWLWAGLHGSHSRETVFHLHLLHLLHKLLLLQRAELSLEVRVHPFDFFERVPIFYICRNDVSPQ